MGRSFVALSALALALGASDASADGAPQLAARLSCRPEASPGRVYCEVELEVASGRLSWVDALVRSSPRFARPLRARVGMRQATSRSDRRVRLPVVLVATDDGKGELAVQARAVVCSGKLCTSAAQMTRAAVQVGPVHEEPP